MGEYIIGKRLSRAEYNYLNLIALEGLNKITLATTDLYLDGEENDE